MVFALIYVLFFVYQFMIDNQIIIANIKIKSRTKLSFVKNWLFIVILNLIQDSRKYGLLKPWIPDPARNDELLYRA